MFCCTLLYVHSGFAIILMGNRELVALLGLSSWCLVLVVWLFLVVPWVCLTFVIVVFPDHTHIIISRGMVKIYFGLLKIEILNKLKSKDFLASSVSTYDFNTLYTTLPHNSTKEKLTELIIQNFSLSPFLCFTMVC